MLLSKLLDLDLAADAEITGLCLDSRSVKPGDLFVAVSGTQSDGRLFIDDAVARGAAAVIHEQGNVGNTATDVPGIELADLKGRLSHLAKKFFNYRQDQLQLVGVTGTNGKTSIAVVLQQLLHLSSYSAGYIGTLGYGKIQPYSSASSLTTPDILTLYACLNQFVQEQCSFAVIEASSHALDQNRLEGLIFSYGIFSNLSRDHFDYHAGFDDYFAAKKKLLDLSDKAVINLDDPYGAELASQRPAALCYSIMASRAMGDRYLVYANNIETSLTATRFDLVFGGQSVSCRCSFTGSFAISNILAACCVLLDMGCSLKNLSQAIEAIKAPSGRLELVARKPIVFIDYAHTPDALEKSLTELRRLTRGRLLVVFGCGGGRDKDKRQLMGKCAGEIADRIFVTSDNPRNEDPQQIIEQIVQGIAKKHLGKLTVESDRANAVAIAFAEAGDYDCLLIAGKGHETGQIVNSQMYEYSDHKTLAKLVQQTC